MYSYSTSFFHSNYVREYTRLSLAILLLMDI